MAREWLQINPEGNIATPSNWGVFPTPAPVYFQLTDSNQFSMRPAPVPWEIRSAGGINRRVLRGSSKTVISGAWNNIVVFASQTPFWATALTPVVPVGMVLPDLPSYSIDHVIVMEDGSNNSVYRRYLGCKFVRGQFTASADSQIMRLSVNIVGKSFLTGVLTPAPTETTAIQYPPSASPDTLVVLEHASATGFTLGSIRAEIDQFSVTIDHKMDPTFFNNTVISRLKWCSRDVDGSIMFPYVVTTDRTTYEATAAITHSGGNSAVFTNGAAVGDYTLTFTFQNANYITAVADNLDYNRVFLQGVTWADYFDDSISAGGPEYIANDFVLTGVVH